VEKEQLDIDEIFEFFCSYVNEQKDLINRNNPNLECICKHHGYSNCSAEYRYLLEDFLTNKLKQIIITEQNFKKNKLRKLERHIILKHYIDGYNLFPYFQIIKIINNRIQNGIMIVDIRNKFIWSEIIRCCIDLINITTAEYELDEKHELNQSAEVKNLIESAQYLKTKGYNVVIQNSRIMIDENTEKKIASKVEDLILDLGGLNVCKLIFSNLEKFYNEKQKRYLITRNLSSLPNQDSKTSIPINYLIQMCLKHLTNYSKYTIGTKGFIRKLNELDMLSRSYVGIWDIEKFSIYSDIFIEVEDLAYYVQENILYDKLFVFKQWNPDFITKLIMELYGDVFRTYATKGELGYSLEEFITIEEEILGCNGSCQEFNLDNLVNKLENINKVKIDLLLNKLAHRVPEINNEFLTLGTATDFSKKPLIKLTNNSYLMICPSLCSFSFIEVLENDLRGLVGKQFDNLLGIQLEKFVKNSLIRKGYKYKDGFYDEQSECDLILETDKKIVFIEIKKKPLTQKAQDGNDINFFNDIGKSLVASQIQLGSHEIYLRKNKQITLRKYQSRKDAGKYPEEHVSYNDKIVERVSLAYHDYGFINSTNIACNIMELLTGVEIHSRDPLIDDELDDLRKKLKTLVDQSRVILNMSGGNERIRNIYFNISFRSLQQFLLALDRSDSLDNFIDILLIDKHTSLGSNDFYKDIEYLSKLRQA
jgi:hypothetical protein